MDQRLLKAEFVQWLQARQRQLKIKHATKTLSGKVVDWIPLESQVAGEIAQPPPARITGTPAHPRHYISFDIAEAGLTGHVPVLRPDILRIANGVTLNRFLAKRGGLRINPKRTNRNPTDPDSGDGYFHARSVQTATNYGCQAWLNAWDSVVDIPSSSGDDHSISQTWVQSYQKEQLQSPTT